LSINANWYENCSIHFEHNNTIINRKPFTLTLHATSKKQNGFTIIELAIVMIIIELLLGSALKGQELINTARVHRLNSVVNDVTSAWHGFRDRFRAYPGDLAEAHSIASLPGGPHGGNGNGKIDTASESGLVWVHLYTAGYLSGTYNDDTISVAVDAYNCSPDYCPDNGYGWGINLSYGTMAQAGGMERHELMTGRGVPVEVLAELDRKIDDGVASTGIMQLGIAGTGWTETEVAACLNGSNYELRSPSDNCAAVFRNL
jgi:type II secretory pathway pseudopilin PulG